MRGPEEEEQEKHRSEKQQHEGDDEKSKKKHIRKIGKKLEEDENEAGLVTGSELEAKES